MSKENFEQFMKQIDESEDLQAKVGKEITGDALVALGAAHGCEFSTADVQASAELSDAELEGVSGSGSDHGGGLAGTRYQNRLSYCRANGGVLVAKVR